MKFETGSLVWARMKGCPAWPGYVSEPPPEMSKQSNKKVKYVCIFFFGSRNYGWVEESNIQGYEEGKETYSKSGKSNLFRKACEEIEEYSERQKSGEIAPPKPSEEDAFDQLMASSTPRKPKKKEPSPGPSNLKRQADESCSDPPTPKRIKDDGQSDVSDDQDTEAPTSGPRPSKYNFGFIGFAGLGISVLRNLLSSNHNIALWGPEQEIVDEFVKYGARKCSSVADVIANSDIILSFQGSPEEAKRTVMGAEQLLSSLNKPKSYVEFTSIDPETAMDISTEIKKNKRTDVRYLEAQLIGERMDADEGLLVILASGDQSLYEDCHTVFEAFGRSSFYLGEVGNACRMRLIIQLLAGVFLAGLAEGMSLAEGCGLPLKELLEILRLNQLGSPFLLTKANAMLIGDHSPQLPLTDLQRDLDMGMLLSEATVQPAPLAAAANEIFKRTKRLNNRDRDASSIYLRSKY